MKISMVYGPLKTLSLKIVHLKVLPYKLSLKKMHLSLFFERAFLKTDLQEIQVR